MEIEEFKLLLANMGDLIHGVAGNHKLTKLFDDEKLKYNWLLVSQMGITMREFPVSEISYKGDDFYKDYFARTFPNEEEIQLFMFRYVKGIYTHSHFVVLCEQLMNGDNISGSINLAIKGNL